MRLIARSGKVEIHDTEGERAEPYWSLFSGVWAHRTWSGEAALSGAQSAPLSSSERLFAVASRPTTQVDRLKFGAVYLEQIDPGQHRAAIHAALFPDRKEHWKGLIDALAVVGAIMAESFGIERFWTTAPPSYTSFAKLLGMKQEGILRDHAIGPDGRRDIVVLGGIWREDMKPILKTTLEAIEWVSPEG